jgi:alkanesulfonate monooxygenase SsuD/methylene tetrahydromethanopterin reductase-like flavin-dependent oxidoreductase (luciferase family)
VAETFNVLAGLFPDRIDLGLGRGGLCHTFGTQMAAAGAPLRAIQ